MLMNTLIGVFFIGVGVAALAALLVIAVLMGIAFQTDRIAKALKMHPADLRNTIRDHYEETHS